MDRGGPLKERRDNHKLCTLFKMSRDLIPPYLTAVLPIQRDTGYNLRRTGDGSMPIISCRLSCMRNSFLFSTMRLWSAMNPALCSSSSIEHFKLNLKKQHLRSTPFFPHLYSCFYSCFKQQFFTHV